MHWPSAVEREAIGRDLNEEEESELQIAWQKGESG